jgi:crossover junction endodeoxyribonuclease RuvC
MKLLGIDPGTATTGFGVIEYTTDYIEAIEYGQIKTNKITLMPTRLVKIYDSVDISLKNINPMQSLLKSFFSVLM